GRSLYGDPGNHALVSLAIFDILRHPALDVPARIIDASTFWPPFPYLASQPLYALGGVGTDVTVFTTTIFFALLIVFTYLLGRQLYGIAAGLLAAFILSFYPILFMLSRTYYQDVALAAMTTITFYLMLRSEAFSQRRFALLFGLSLGLTALTKQSFFTMVAVPVGVGVAIALSSAGAAGWRELLAWRPGQILSPPGAKLAARMLNVLFAGLLAALIAAPWYIQNIDLFFWQTGDVRTADNFGGKPFWWYLGHFDETLLIWPWALALIGLVTALRHPKRHWLPLAWFLGASIIYPLVTRQHMRHMLPVLPAIALLSAQWIVALHRVWLRRVLVAATVVFQVAMFFVMSWGAPMAWNQALRVPVQNDYLPYADGWFERPLLIDPLAFLYNQYPPRPHRWPVNAILQRTYADLAQTDRSDQPVRLTLLTKIPDFGFPTFAYEAERARRLQPDAAQALSVEDVANEDDFLADFLDTDYALVKTGDIGVSTYRPNTPVVRDAWVMGDEALRQRFAVLRRWHLQDGTTAELIKRQGAPLADLPPDELQPLVGLLLAQTPTSPKTLRLRQTLLAAGLFPGPVLSAAQQALAIDDASPYLALSQSQIDGGDIAEAEATLRRGTEQMADPTDLWTALGKLLTGQGRSEEAETALEEAIRISPDDPLAILELATLHESMARSALQSADQTSATSYWTAAHDEYRRALELNPQLVRPYSGLGQFYRNAKDWPAAVAIYQQGLAALPNEPWLTLGLAQTYNESGDTDTALPYYQEALRLQPQNPFFHAQVGNAFSRLQRWDEAIVAYRTALEIDPQQHAASFALGEALERTGDTEAAVDIYRRLVEQTPDTAPGQRAAERLKALEQ
ncbi:MAG TPA: tetratricopeptide repeat protein, partial [Anaerolineae bacterium]|nr:tetratricopeptide repeat protein [Anaerolineae bacterium]